VIDGYLDDQTFIVNGLENKGLEEDWFVFLNNDLAATFFLPDHFLGMIFELNFSDELRHFLGSQSAALLNVEDC